MPTLFATANWSIHIPEGWTASEDPECVTLTGSAPIGALQISASFKRTEVFDSDLREFASDHLDAGAVPAEVHAGDFVGLEFAFDTEDACWRQWYLRYSNMMLYVTYNCDLADRGAEDAAVNSAVGSLKAVTSAGS